jgi:hypothetical protein
MIIASGYFSFSDSSDFRFDSMIIMGFIFESEAKLPLFSE